MAENEDRRRVPQPVSAPPTEIPPRHNASVVELGFARDVWAVARPVRLDSAASHATVQLLLLPTARLMLVEGRRNSDCNETNRSCDKRAAHIVELG